ncbi:hypothetical protein HXX76_015166 [Chlamydomonas incerta]|uniref:Uncharacterized protein n=1 Tax=Chlamydomonas incerta TaxID=51695 RepID=A0A835SJR9_CHLIN|nr:hypothetical protein HXX76_015166 [Chlamydomonas incerta]|eukprot:KAG2423649.1 hypothetical protein HXX76_015166 [Chlamydomonas incerta]
MHSLAALLALTLAWQGAVAYPRFWYDRKYLASQGYAAKDGYDWSVFPDDGSNCTSYPEKAYTGFFPAHGIPYMDSAIGMAFARAGANVTTLCPGAKHTVTVSFPIKRLALLVTSPNHAVHFSSPAPATSNCPGRIDLGGSKNSHASSSFTATFTVPCAAGSTNGSSTVVFTVNSAGTSGATRRWAQAAATLQIAPESAAECAAVSAVCANGGGATDSAMPASSSSSGSRTAAHKPPPAMGGRRNPPPTRRPPPHRG